MWWPNLDKDIVRLAKSCKACQSVKHSPAVAPLRLWTWPSKPWDRVHVDFAGVIVERLGPLPYLIETEAYQFWKRHVNQLKEVTDSPLLSTEFEVVPEWNCSYLWQFTRACSTPVSATEPPSAPPDSSPAVPDPPNELVDTPEPETPISPAPRSPLPLHLR